MARTSVTTVRASLDGGELVAATAPSVDGDIIDTGNVLLLVSATTNPVTVTIQATRTSFGLELDDAGGVVAAGTTRAFGPFPASLFAQAVDAVEGPARVLVDYSAAADATRMVVAL